MGPKQRGFSIGSYVAALTVFAIFTLTMVTVATQHLQFSSVAYHQQAAKNLAEAAIQQTLIKIIQTEGQTYGTQRKNFEVIRVDRGTYPAGSYGVVLFNKVDAAAQKLPYSTNNFNGVGEELGDLKRTVPLNAIQLVGTGVCGDSKRTVEAIYYIPPFPSALASEGPVRSTGSLLVAGVRDPSKFTGSYDSLPPEEKSPSHVFSNSRDPLAVQLASGALIKGNVGAVGGIEVVRSDVQGDVRPYSDPQPLPKIDLDTLAARLTAQITKDPVGPNVAGDYTLEWNAQCDSDLHIGGSLNLHQGMLFVRGNLEVDGGVTGDGTIYVGGKTTIHRGADFRAKDQVALMSRDKIVLDGAGQNQYFFQGMLYSEAEVEAKDVTVLGSCIARGVGGLTFHNVNALNSPVTVSLINGIELHNLSDDDSVLIIIRVEDRDPRTRKPTSYKVLIRGSGDDHGTMVSTDYIVGTGLRNYDEVKNWIANSDRGVWGATCRDSFHLDWYWVGGDQSDKVGQNPLKNYMDMLEAKYDDPNHYFGFNLDPNEVVGVLDRSRVLLWQDVANPY